MQLLNGRLVPFVVALSPLIGAAACSAQLPASTPPASAPAKLFRHDSVEAAWKAAVARRRPMVVLFTSDNCPYCDRMLDETYADPRVRQLLDKHAESAQARSKDYAKLIDKLGVRGFPTTLIVAADGQIAGAIEGFVDAPAFLEGLAPWVGPNASTSAPSNLPSGG